MTICSAHTSPEHIDDSSKRVYGNLSRSSSIRKYYGNSNSVSQAMRAYPDVDWRHMFLDMDGATLALDFRNSTTWAFQE